jgi:hypothetical protein
MECRESTVENHLRVAATIIVRLGYGVHSERLVEELHVVPMVEATAFSDFCVFGMTLGIQQKVCDCHPMFGGKHHTLHLAFQTDDPNGH